MSQVFERDSRPEDDHGKLDTTQHDDGISPRQANPPYTSTPPLQNEEERDGMGNIVGSDFDGSEGDILVKRQTFPALLVVRRL